MLLAHFHRKSPEFWAQGGGGGAGQVHGGPAEPSPGGVVMGGTPATSGVLEAGWTSVYLTRK